MRWAVLGAGGMLGVDVCSLLQREGDDVDALQRGQLDVRDPQACERALSGVDVVVNCAAYTRVDDAEMDEPLAFDINALAVANVAKAVARGGGRLVHISTDYVFGDEEGPDPLDEDTPLSPRSAYGRTKAAGEWAAAAHCPEHLIVRTAWLYGRGGGCFPKTVVRLLSERGRLSVVDDQHGQPTWTADVADLIVGLVRADALPGIYHATSSGRATWFDLATAVADIGGFSPAQVSPTTTAAFPRPAPRPRFSVLGHRRLIEVGVQPIPPWRQRLEAAADAVLAPEP